MKRKAASVEIGSNLEKKEKLHGCYSVYGTGRLRHAPDWFQSFDSKEFKPNPRHTQGVCRHVIINSLNAGQSAYTSSRTRSHPIPKYQVLCFQLISTHKIYLVKYFVFRHILLFACRFLRHNITADWNKISTVGRPRPPWCTRHTWGLIRRGSVGSIISSSSTMSATSTTSGQAPHNYRPRSRHDLYPTKAKFFYFSWFNYLFTFATPKIPRGCTITFVTTNILGYLANFFSSA
jgi:hypothetical protein